MEWDAARPERDRVGSRRDRAAGERYRNGRTRERDGACHHVCVSPDPADDGARSYQVGQQPSTSTSIASARALAWTAAVSYFAG